MLAGIKKIGVLIGAAIFSIATISIGYSTITRLKASSASTNHYAASEFTIDKSSSQNYEKIYENSNYEYYYIGRKGIIKIRDKKTGFMWQTGTDSELRSTVTASCQSVLPGSPEAAACSIEAGPGNRGNATGLYYASINELLTFTYFSNNISTEAHNYSDSNNTSTVKFLRHKDHENEWMYVFTYKGRQSFALNMRITFTDEGLDVNMYDEDIAQEGTNNYLIEAIYPLPRFGQSGGKMIACTVDNPDENGYGRCSYNTDNLYNNPVTNLDGYVFIPDGSGALIQFDDIKYYQPNSFYYFDVYGDPYRSRYDLDEFPTVGHNVILEPDYVATKQISMPVWGVSYEEKNAFVAYVTSGDEYFGLKYSGRTSTFEYATISPRFERNRTYNYEFGGSKTRLILNENEVYHYDIGVSYKFLNGDGTDDSLPATYEGMALKYRDYLVSNNVIKSDNELVVGPKVDFLICDVKKGVFGYSDVVVTTTDDIENILKDLSSMGIKNVDSSLYGWQDGGISTAKPWKSNYNNLAGGKSGFKNVVDTASSLDYSINFYQQYGMINEVQVASFNAYCVKALSRDYGTYQLYDVEKPIITWEYVNANVAGTWLNRQAKALQKDFGNVGITTGGISTLLVPDYGKSLTYAGAAEALESATTEASKIVSLGGDTPNAYMLKNYSNIYNLSVENSQLKCETEAVPFMEIVLGGLVNMYAEYSNFSFYDDASKLSMIDYNINPSFIISNEENEDIMYTNARDWFSTGYDDYRDIIKEINDDVVPYLELIKGKTLVKRTVDSSSNVKVNVYANYENGKIVEGSEVTIALNYSGNDISYEYGGKQVLISALSAKQIL